MSRLNYHHLYYFWQVAKAGKLTQTAQKLHLSQSALSSQIKQLEERLGLTLFERRGRRLHLTQVGGQVFTYAQDIFKKGEELEQVIQHGFTSPAQLLRIGILATMSRNFVKQFIAPLGKKPNLSYILHSYDQASLLNALANHQLDVALTNIEVRGTHTELWQSQLLDRQPIAVVGPPTLDLPNTLTSAYFEQPWVLPLEQNPIRAAFDRLCAYHQFVPNIIAQSDDMAMLRLLARDNQAMAVLPEVVVQDELSSHRLACYLNLPQCFENFYGITMQRRFPNELVFELIEKCVGVNTSASSHLYP